jgi:hypothetical protein
MLASGWGKDTFGVIERYPFSLLVLRVECENVIIVKGCGFGEVLMLAAVDEDFSWGEFYRGVVKPAGRGYVKFLVLVLGLGVGGKGYRRLEFFWCKTEFFWRVWRFWC